MRVRVRDGANQLVSARVEFVGADELLELGALVRDRVRVRLRLRLRVRVRDRVRARVRVS